MPTKNSGIEKTERGQSGTNNPTRRQFFKTVGVASLALTFWSRLFRIASAQVMCTVTNYWVPPQQWARVFVRANFPARARPWEFKDALEKDPKAALVRLNKKLKPQRRIIDTNSQAVTENSRILNVKGYDENDKRIFIDYSEEDLKKIYEDEDADKVELSNNFWHDDESINRNTRFWHKKPSP